MTGSADDSVLAVVRGGKDVQFDACYVACLSVRTGAVRWVTFVGSGLRSVDGEGSVNQDPSQLALADGRAYVMTNLGTVAALDPADGRVVWMTGYARDVTAAEEGVRRFQPVMPTSGSTKPWARNPCLVQGGRVFALPADARTLLVLDAATGRSLKQIVTTNLAGDGDTPNVLLGVYDDVLRGGGGTVQCLAMTGDKHVYGVDWRAYNPGNDIVTPPVRPTAIRLKGETITGGSGTANTDDCAVAGRGFLTARSIFVTTPQTLIEYDWHTGKIANTYPAAGTFTGGQGPGNVLVTAQDVVVAGRDRVDVYTDLPAVTARYQREIDAAPADPDPRVRFANVLFAGGQPTEALARIDQAVGLLGGPGHLRPGPGRQLVFDTLMDFGRRAAAAFDRQAADAAAKRPPAVALGHLLYDRAADAADTPDDRVAYLLARARFDRDVAGDDAAALGHYQQVLSEATLRSVALSDEQTAATAAAAAIAAVARTDPAAYAGIEATAVAALADARKSGTIDALLAMAEVYPNSRAAVDARAAAVDQLQANGQAARATSVLRQTYAAAADPAVKAAVLARIATNLLADGPTGVGPAADRMAWAAQLAGSRPLAADFALPGGAVLRHDRDTYTAAVDALRLAVAAQSTAALPEFHLASLAQRHAAQLAEMARKPPVDRDGHPIAPPPLNPFAAAATTIPNVDALVHPTAAFDRHDRVVTWSRAAGVAVYAAGQTTPRFTLPTVTETPLGAAWVHDVNAKHTGDWLLVWTATGVTAVGDDGRAAWPATLALGNGGPLPAVAASTGAVTDDLAQSTTTDPEEEVLVGGGRVFVNQQVIINGQLVRRGQFIPRGRINRAVPVPPPQPVMAAAPPGGAEEVVTVRPAGPTGAVVLVVTNRGRMMGVDGQTGTVLWQSRPADRDLGSVQANGHFAVCRVDDAAGGRIVVYDVASGHVVGRRSFGVENAPNQLVNVALGEDGLLAITTSSQVEVKDLYSPWREPPVPLVSKQNVDPAGFNGMVGPDQLLVSAGRVVALYASGQTWRAWDAARPGSEPTLPTGTGSNPSATPMSAVSLRLDGPRLFVCQSAGVSQFNLADPADVAPNFDLQLPHGDTPQIRSVMLGTDAVLMIHDKVDRGPTLPTVVTLIVMTRKPAPGTTRMAGNWDFVYPMKGSAGIADYAGVDGGLYVQTGDSRLVYFRGGGDDGPATRP